MKNIRCPNPIGPCIQRSSHKSNNWVPDNDQVRLIPFIQKLAFPFSFLLRFSSLIVHGLKMEIDLSQINSFQVKKTLHIGIVELNRKRKLQAEHLDLPSPKHKCPCASFHAKPAVTFDENGEIEESEISKGGSVDDGSETESGKDSNSFVGDSEFAMSRYSEMEDGTTFLDENEIAFMAEEHDSSLRQCNELQALKNLADPLLALGSHFDYICSQHANENAEQLPDEMFDDVFSSNEQNPNTYVLSSGRWNVNQDSQNGTKKPTIDQEFEQYFSMLML